MQGVFTALVTPFNSDGSLDLAAFKKILLDQKDAGVQGVIPCGTTGEGSTLTLEEKKTLITLAIETMRGSQTKVIAGTGSNDTAATIELSRWASKQKVAGVLVVTPYYNKPSQAGLEMHFKAVADAVDCEVMLYNVPGRTGVALTAETIVRLARHERIRSIKEASGNVAFTSEILDQLGAAGVTMDILSGDDATFLPLLTVGAVGVVSVASNLFPRAMVALYKKRELELHRRFYPLFRDLFIDSNPGPIKYAMARHGLGAMRLRAPLTLMVEANQQILEASLERCGIKAGAKL